MPEAFLGGIVVYTAEAELFRAMGDPIRLRILALLRVRDACVCELAARLPVSQPAVSQHLRRLRQAGLLVERRYKQWTFYGLRPDLSPLLRELIASLPADPDDEAWLRQHRVESTCSVLEPGPPGAAEVPGGRPVGRVGAR